ncbi:MAG TPA: post-COAP-1 domain-containing protein, partial [Gemmatimonadales bacterium]|nr:post-COAP-1 domain-containing protein [Gemmatimonadales bacterium]
DPNPPNEQVLAVRANLSQPITSGGVLLSAFTGVDPVFARAFTGVKSSASGSGASPTIAHPGAIPLNANALAYGVSMTNVPVTVGPPPDFTHIAAMSDGLTMATDGVFTVRTSATSVDPQWTWFFDALHPGTWLATVLALNPAPTTGNLTVSNTTTGSSFPSTFTVTVDAGTPSATSQPMVPNGRVTFNGLAAGSHSVTLAVASNCTVTSTNPVNVNVPAGGTANTSFTVSCSTPQARAQVSGGGRIDPSVGKTTFGFNVDGRSGPPFQGEMQVVYHGGTSPMTRIHSVSIDGLTTSPDSRGGICITWTGSARVNNADQRRFTATACDNGEPGSSPGKGPDRFGITVDGSVSIGVTDLTGGNTQARQ